MVRVGLTSAIFLLACLATGTIARPASPEPVPPDQTETRPGPQPTDFSGSASCRSCHERFYELWAPSYHGRAMQPFTAELGRTQLTPKTADIVIGDYRYRAEIGGETGLVRERGPEERNTIG